MHRSLAGVVPAGCEGGHCAAGGEGQRHTATPRGTGGWVRVWLGLKGLKEARGWGKQGVQENRWGGIRREFMGVRACVGG